MAAVPVRLNLRQVASQRHEGERTIPVTPLWMSHKIVPQGADRSCVEK